VAGHGRHGLGALGVDGEEIRCRVVGVGAYEGQQARAQRSLLISRQCVVIMRSLSAGGDIQPFGGFAMQPVRGPVRSDVTAMTPDRAELMSADGLPDLPALFDLAARVEGLAVRGHHGFRYGWHHTMDFATHPEQHGK
jgi:hypothetical protein